MQLSLKTASPALLCILLVLGSPECAVARINTHCYQDEFGSWRSKRSTQGVQERELVQASGILCGALVQLEVPSIDDLTLVTGH